MLHGCGLETGVDLEQLAEAGRYISEFLGRCNGSKYANAREGRWSWLVDWLLRREWCFGTTKLWGDRITVCDGLIVTENSKFTTFVLVDLEVLICFLLDKLFFGYLFEWWFFDDFFFGSFLILGHFWFWVIYEFGLFFDSYIFHSNREQHFFCAGSLNNTKYEIFAHFIFQLPKKTSQNILQ